VLECRKSSGKQGLRGAGGELHPNEMNEHNPYDQLTSEERSLSFIVAFVSNSHAEFYGQPSFIPAAILRIRDGEHIRRIYDWNRHVRDNGSRETRLASCFASDAKCHSGVDVVPTRRESQPATRRSNHSSPPGDGSPLSTM
jgi:hypothetical protein